MIFVCLIWSARCTAASSRRTPAELPKSTSANRSSCCTVSRSILVELLVGFLVGYLVVGIAGWNLFEEPYSVEDNLQSEEDMLMAGLEFISRRDTVAIMISDVC